jgi:hypothetical protein
MKFRSLSILLLVLAFTASACLLSMRQKVQLYTTDELTMVRVKPGVTEKQLKRLADQLSEQNMVLDYSQSEYDGPGKHTALRFSVKGPGFSANHRTSPFDQPILFKHIKKGDTVTSEIGTNQVVTIPGLINLRLLFGPYALLFFGIALGLIMANFIILILKAKSLKR